MKKKSKLTKALIAASFFITIIAIFSPVLAANPNRFLMLDVMAKGDDGDIFGATTSIIAKIKYDKATGTPLADVEFQTKIYDEDYSMKGKFKDGILISKNFEFPCDVREVLWINLWFVMGDGLLKTTDADIVIDYRGFTIPLPNTKGKYLPFSFWMFVSPKGEFISDEYPGGSIWPEGGWATVIILSDGDPSVGAVTYLTKYMEKVVPDNLID
ncbi:MAG: hypothetical protein ACW986_14430 [Promethearchaeota archaeon]